MEFKIPRRRRRRKHLLQSETRSFSISIAIIRTHLLCLMQANSSGVEFLRTISKFKAGEREKISSSFVHVYPKMWNLVISRRSRTATTKKCAKECAARAELLFYIKFSYGPFTACHSRGTKPPCWEAKVALGQDQPKAYIIFVYPSATFASQHGDFVSGEWQAAKGLLPMRRSC